MVFHAAIVDDCDRAAASGQTDLMALRLRENAMGLARLQMAMLAVISPIEAGVLRLQDAADTKPDPDGPEPFKPPNIEAPNIEAPNIEAPGRILAGDALARFTSGRLLPEDSPHEIWQNLQEMQPDKRRRSPGLPKAGFRSRSS